MPPTLFLIGKTGPMMFLPGKVCDDDSKDKIVGLWRSAFMEFNQ